MWDDLDGLSAPDIRAAEQQRADTDRLFLRVFGNEHGKELMAWLRQHYVEPAVATPGTDASHAYYREGQRSVILTIEARLRRAINE